MGTEYNWLVLYGLAVICGGGAVTAGGGALLGPPGRAPAG